MTVAVKCTHNIVCLSSGQEHRLLHPMDMTVCPDSARPTNDIKAVEPPTTLRGTVNPALTTHRAVLLSGEWVCAYCGKTRPFGQGRAEFDGECDMMRRWSDQPIGPGAVA